MTIHKCFIYIPVFVCLADVFIRKNNLLEVRNYVRIVTYWLVKVSNALSSSMHQLVLLTAGAVTVSMCVCVTMAGRVTGCRVPVCVPLVTWVPHVRTDALMELTAVVVNTHVSVRMEPPANMTLEFVSVLQALLVHTVRLVSTGLPYSYPHLMY